MKRCARPGCLNAESPYERNKPYCCMECRDMGESAADARAIAYAECAAIARGMDTTNLRYARDPAALVQDIAEAIEARAKEKP
jgi:hypothetical protein